jgi:hypothetical protein
MAAGCVTTIEKEKPFLPESGDTALEFPDAKACLVQTSHILHEVKFYFEMDRLPKRDEEPVFGWLVNLPGKPEEYLAGYEDNPAIQDALRSGGKPKASLLKEPPGTHRFSYDQGMFAIGGFRYPAEQYGEIIIFKERPGTFSFQFHGRTVTVERSASWKPAVLYRLNREQDSREQPLEEISGKKSGTRRKRVSTRIVSEEVQVGPHRIVAAPGSATWKVNDATIQAPAGASIIIDRRGGVRSSS